MLRQPVREFSHLSLLPFSPAKWAKDSHLQTILGDILPSPPLNDPGEILEVDLKGHNRLRCRLHRGNTEWAVIIGHGLTGNSDAGYIQRVTAHLQNLKMTVVRMNHRNCGEGIGLAKQTYHAGSSDDIARVVFDLRLKFPGIKVVTIGYSLSGNATLLLAGEVYPNLINDREYLSLPDAAIAINPPVHLFDATAKFVTGFNRLYQWNFMREYKKLNVELKKRGILSEKLVKHPLMTIREFDEVHTAKSAGFDSVEQFYEGCSAVNHLQQIKIPTWILAAQDDPILDPRPLLDAPKSEFLQIHMEKHGGHMGFLANEKTPFGDIRWMDYAVVEMINNLIWL